MQRSRLRSSVSGLLCSIGQVDDSLNLKHPLVLDSEATHAFLVSPSLTGSFARHASLDPTLNDTVSSGSVQSHRGCLYTLFSIVSLSPPVTIQSHLQISLPRTLCSNSIVTSVVWVLRSIEDAIFYQGLLIPIRIIVSSSIILGFYI